MGFVPYIKPGFDLAKAAAEVYEQDPSVNGLILDKHGIFTFAETAKEAYDLMIHYVTLAEDYVAKNAKAAAAPAALPASLAKPADIASVAARRGRGRTGARAASTAWSATSAPRRPSWNSCRRRDLADLARIGVSTPDLSIRIKTGPMVLPAPEAGKIADYPAVIREKVAAFAADYDDLLQDQRCARRRQAHHARPDAAPDAGARRSACSAMAAR